MNSEAAERLRQFLAALELSQLMARVPEGATLSLGALHLTAEGKTLVSEWEAPEFIEDLSAVLEYESLMHPPVFKNREAVALHWVDGEWEASYPGHPEHPKERGMTPFEALTELRRTDPTSSVREELLKPLTDEEATGLPLATPEEVAAALHEVDQALKPLSRAKKV